MPIPALRVPSRTLESQAYCRLAPLPGPRSLDFSSTLGTPLDLDPPPQPSPGSSRHPPRLCHTPSARASHPPSRPHSPPFAHPVSPSSALWLEQPAASPSPGRLRGRPGHRPALELSMVSVLGSLASPTSCCRHRRGGAGGAGIPPAAPLTRGYPGPCRPECLGLRVLLAGLSASSSAPQVSRDPSTFLRSQGF